MNPVKNAWETRKWTSKPDNAAVNRRCSGRPVLAPPPPKRIPHIGINHVTNENHGEDLDDPNNQGS